jgi:hypothetical protein
MCRFIYATLFALSLAACEHRSSPRRVYVGEIVRIQFADGAHYSITKGPTPLVFIYVRLRDAARLETRGEVRLALTDLYSAPVHGTVGDTVSFQCSKRLPGYGDLPFGDIEGYRAVPKKPSSGRRKS